MAKGDALRGRGMGRKSGERQKRGEEGCLRWDDAAAQRAQAAAAASRAAEGSGTGESESEPEVVAGRRRRPA
eukprot:7777776-Pyramimonas_sp.AAC.1